MNTRRNPVKRGFTLIEILIVVVILGILAAIIVPQFTDAAQNAGASSARSQLQSLRSQIELHRVQNNGTAPVNLQELVDDGYIRALPTWPQGFNATYPDENGDLTLEFTGTPIPDVNKDNVGNDADVAAIAAW
jgi:type II secretion system protein G